MPRLGDAPLTRIHIRIFPEDYAKLQRLFNSDPNNPLMGKVLRSVIHEFLKSGEDRIRRIIDQNSEPAPVPSDLSLEAALGVVVSRIKDSELEL